eukprot:371929-Rhodomonas_salina.1
MRWLSSGVRETTEQQHSVAQYRTGHSMGVGRYLFKPPSTLRRSCSHASVSTCPAKREHVPSKP